MAGLDLSGRVLAGIVSLVLTLVIIGFYVGTSLGWLGKAQDNNENVNNVLDASVLAVYNEYNAKEVSGQAVLNAIEAYPHLGILIGNKTTSTNYTYTGYNKKLGLRENERDNMSAANDSDRALSYLTANFEEYYVDEDDELTSDAVPDLGDRRDLTKKSKKKLYVPPYGTYYARLVVYENKVTGLVFKEILDAND